ncbi:MAG: hypothetical protein WAM79_10345 [Candidatus Sulfotelmatobacter sp.]
MMPRIYLAGLIAILILAGAGCKKQPAPSTLDTSEHLDLPSINGTPASGTQTVLEKTFDLKVSAMFPFEVPAHAAQPHLHGIFQSFAGQVHGPSDETADIGFAILNESQQADAANDQPTQALFSVDASHDQSVNFDLPPTEEQPVKYYLVFRNPHGSKKNKFVQAHFRIDF